MNASVGDIAGIIDIKVPQGSDMTLPVWSEDKDGKYIDFTGCTAALQVRKAVESKTTILELTTENGGIVIYPEETDPGRMDLIFKADVTKDISCKKGIYHLEVYTASGKTYRLIKGNFHLNREVVR